MNKTKDVNTYAEEEVKECCSARGVLWYLVFVGFAVNYMIRINLNLAIVAMVQPKPKDSKSLSSECLRQTELDTIARIQRYSENSTENYTDFNTTHALDGNSTHLTASPLNLTHYLTTSRPLQISTTLQSAPHLPASNDEHGESKFMWDEKIQGFVLGSFFWLHWTTQVPGGLLANKYGTKIVFGLSNFSGVFFCLFIPFFAKMGPTYLMGLRMVQGILLGFAWPSMHSMTARWIPPNERSKFVTAYLGSSVGTAMTYPICGFIIDRWGWEYVFYACSAFGALWFTAWCCLVHDSPSEHPRISQEEKDYILKSLGQSVAKEKAPVPWAAIFKDPTVWVNIFAQWGGLWGLFTLMTHAPTYFKFIHGWNIKATGVLSGLPHLLRMGWAYIFSQIGDYLLRSNKMTRSNVRKLATVICCGGQGVCMMALAYSGCDATMAIIFLSMAVGIHGSVSTGPLASVVDISPNYAAILMGLLNTAAAFVGFFTAAVIGSLTHQNQTTPQWQKVYWIASMFLFLSALLYVIFAKSELKPWNSPEIKEPEQELMVVKTEKDGKNKEKDKENGIK